MTINLPRLHFYPISPLPICILQVLLDAGTTTVKEAIRAKAILLERYNPITRCVEEVDEWQTEL